MLFNSFEDSFNHEPMLWTLFPVTLVLRGFASFVQLCFSFSLLKYPAIHTDLFLTLDV